MVKKFLVLLVTSNMEDQMFSNFCYNFVGGKNKVKVNIWKKVLQNVWPKELRKTYSFPLLKCYHDYKIWRYIMLFMNLFYVSNPFRFAF